jgi:hypothetical protein
VKEVDARPGGLPALYHVRLGTADHGRDGEPGHARFLPPLY